MKTVVTGIGFVTPLGTKVEDLWESVCSSGVLYHARVNGMGSHTNDKIPRFVRVGLEAADNAARDAGLNNGLLKECGMTISSSKGDVERYFNNNNELALPHSAGRFIARELGCQGPILNVVSACATGIDSILAGERIIKTGRAKIVLSGGTDACINDFMVSGYSKLGVLTKDKCSPYDKKRDGFSLSEGAAVVVLEEKQHALSRRAQIYGELGGGASLHDAYHITSMDPGADAITEAIKLCMKRAGTSYNDIDYINTHGTGTKINDIVETKAIKQVFKEHSSNIPLSSVKPITGHMLAASGTLECIIGLLAMKNNFIPPTANLTDPDPLCDLDYVPQKGRKHTVNRFLSLSYGFGGHVAVVGFRKAIFPNLS